MDKDIVTIESLIQYLTNNFNKDDKLCQFDEGGAYCEVVYVPQYFLGKYMFRKIKDKIKSEHIDTKKENYIDDIYTNVNEEDVVIY